MTQPGRLILVASTAGLLGATASLAPLAADAATSGRACFARVNVESFNATDNHTVYLRAGDQYYRLDLMTRCLDLAFKQSIGLEDRPSDAFVCSPLEATVVYRVPGGIPQRCPVRAMHKLTPAEVAAFPKRDLP
jgi:hypothetical protein